MTIAQMKSENLYKRYLVILVDRQKGKFFTIYAGTFEGQGEDVFDDVHQKVKNDNGRQGKVPRHIRDQMLKHLEKVGEKAMDYLVALRIKQLDGVFIGTHKELFSDVKDSLPSKLRHKILGKFVSTTDRPVGDVTNDVISHFNL